TIQPQMAASRVDVSPNRRPLESAGRHRDSDCLPVRAQGFRTGRTALVGHRITHRTPACPGEPKAALRPCTSYRPEKDGPCGGCNGRPQHRAMSSSQNVGRRSAWQAIGLVRRTKLWKVGPGLPGYSGLMPANLITLAHFSVSASLPKSAGDPGSTGECG